MYTVRVHFEYGMAISFYYKKRVFRPFDNYIAYV